MRRWKPRRLASLGRLRRLATIAAAALSAQPLAGCFLTDERVPAAIDIPKAYRYGPRNADAALPSPVWWRGFRSRELTDLIEEALTSNFDIAAAVARIVQADAQSRIVGARLLPAIDFGGEINRRRSGGIESTNYRTSLIASYEIDFWGKNRAALRAAEESAVASRFDREVVALTTMTAVANSYFQVMAAYDRLRVARNNLAAAERIYRLIEERFNVGTASALDTAQQESVVNSQRAAIPLLEQELRQTIITLAVLIGRPPENFVIRAGSLLQFSVPRVTPGLPSDLITQRPDVREAEAQLAAANANVFSARAAFLPSITLTGEGGYASSALKALLRPESSFYNLAAGLVQPLLDGALLQGQLDLRKGQQDELLQLYRKAIINGFADVEKALVAVQQTARREQLQREVVRSTRQAFSISETRLREGTVDLITVLNTQLALFLAEDAQIQARLARLQAVVGLFQALGGGWLLPPDNSRTRR
jgi:multidrug efflux system outer membrane protein